MVGCVARRRDHAEGPPRHRRAARHRARGQRARAPRSARAAAPQRPPARSAPVATERLRVVEMVCASARSPRCRPLRDRRPYALGVTVARGPRVHHPRRRARAALVPASVIGPAFGARTSVTPSGTRSVTSATFTSIAGGRFPTVSSRRRDLGRADRVLPGIWRLRLPLLAGRPARTRGRWRPATASCWSTPATHEDALAELERTLATVGRRLEDVRLVVCTHAHSDHYGLAAPIVERAGCELWMHPNHQHMTRAIADPQRALERRVEVARQRWCAARAAAPLGGGAARLESGHRRRDRAGPRAGAGRRGRDRPRRLGGTTPRAAPSHVVLFEPRQRLLLSGDHLLERVSPYFDYGWTPDPWPSSSTASTPSRRWAPVPTGPRAPVRRRGRARERQPQGDGRHARADRGRARRAGADGLRGGLARVPGVRAVDDELGADHHALLPHPPRADGPRGARQDAW